MNYEQANAVKHLAPRVMKILKKLNIKCSECRGSGYIKHNNDEIRSHCRSCQTRGKIKWEWQSKEGEWAINKEGNIELIDKELATILSLSPSSGNLDFIPILEWEEIERVLAEAGYRIKFLRGLSDRFEYTIFINLYGKDIFDRPFRDDGHSRQEAVMKAVLELGKELKK